VAHDGANRHDSKLLAPTLDSIPIQRPEPSADSPQGLCFDGGYAYPWVDALAAGRGYTAHIRRRSDELELKRTTPGCARDAGSSKPATPGSTATAPC